MWLLVFLYLFFVWLDCGCWIGCVYFGIVYIICMWCFILCVGFLVCLYYVLIGVCCNLIMLICVLNMFFMSGSRWLWCVRNSIWVCVDRLCSVLSFVFVCVLLKLMNRLLVMNGSVVWLLSCNLSVVICSVRNSWLCVFLFNLVILIDVFFVCCVYSVGGVCLVLMVSFVNLFSVSLVKILFVCCSIGFCFWLW